LLDGLYLFWFMGCVYQECGKHGFSFLADFPDHYLYVPVNPEEPFMGAITDNPRMRERTYVFSDRHDAGRQLGAFVKTLPGIRNPLVLAIPAGGVPVGREVATALGAPFSLAIVRKIRIPGSTESGFGAVTWDGQVLINEDLRAALGLSDSDVDRAIDETRTNVNERIARFMGGHAGPSASGKTVILTDDGLASGFTMLAAARSIRRSRPAHVIVAVPTASASSAGLVSREVDQLVCLNIRSSRMFAVAEAYERWYDLDDQEVLEELSR
jgi:putative phosphoribosyl transferase